MSGDSLQALTVLRDARLRDPNNPDIRYHLAVVLEKSGRRDEAREEINAALDFGKPFAHAAEARRLQQAIR